MSTQQTSVTAISDPTLTQDIPAKIRAYLEVIAKAQGDPEISAVLAGRGFGPASLAEGVELCQAAQLALHACQSALSAQKQAEAEYECIYASARQIFMDYRMASLPIMKNGAIRFELGLEGRLPEDPVKFLAIARSGYKVAYHTPAYLSRLKKSESGLNLLETGCASLEALLAAGNAHEAVKAVAIDATIESDLAMGRLKDWARRFRRMVRSVLKERPDLLQKLGMEG